MCRNLIIKMDPMPQGAKLLCSLFFVPDALLHLCSFVLQIILLLFIIWKLRKSCSHVDEAFFDLLLVLLKIYCFIFGSLQLFMCCLSLALMSLDFLLDLLPLRSLSIQTVLAVFDHVVEECSITVLLSAC